MRIEKFKDLEKAKKNKSSYFYCYYLNLGTSGLVHEYKMVDERFVGAFCNTSETMREGFITTDYVQAERWAND